MREHIGIVVGVGKLGRTVEEFLGSPENRVGFPLDGLGNIERIGFAEPGRNLQEVAFGLGNVFGRYLGIGNSNKAVEEVSPSAFLLAVKRTLCNDSPRLLRTEAITSFAEGAVFCPSPKNEAFCPNSIVITELGSKSSQTFPKNVSSSRYFTSVVEDEFLSAL